MQNIKQPERNLKSIYKYLNGTAKIKKQHHIFESRNIPMQKEQNLKVQKGRCKPKTEWPQRNLEEPLKRFEDKGASSNK